MEPRHERVIQQDMAMQVVFIRQGGIITNDAPGEFKPIVQFLPIGRRVHAMEFLEINIDPWPPLVGLVNADIPFGVWIDRDAAPAFQLQFACPKNGDEAWRQARDFKKSFDEARELRDQLSTRVESKRQTASI